MPDEEEVLKSGLSLQGGVCYHMNVFMDMLLKALGYTTHFITGLLSPTNQHNSHIAIVVEGLDDLVKFGSARCGIYSSRSS